MKTIEEKKAHRKEYNHKYWAEHAAEISERRKLTKPQRTEWQREWYKTNREKWNAYCREYRRKKKEQRERAKGTTQICNEELYKTGPQADQVKE